METLRHVFGWALRNSWEASLLILLALACQRVFRGRFDARWRGRLWLLVALRLALPAGPESGLSVFNYSWLNLPPPVASALAADTKSSAASDRDQRYVGCAEASVSRPGAFAVTHGVTGRRSVPGWAGAKLRSLAPWATIGWAVVVVGLALRAVGQNLRLAARIRERCELYDRDLLNVLRECARALGLRRLPEVIELEGIEGPALYGCWRPRVLLPQGMSARLTRAELRQVFLHELAHIRRCDMAVNWLTTALRVAHWFNPLVALAFRRLAEDRELACDTLALSVANPAERVLYGETLLKLHAWRWQRGPLAGVVGILNDQSQIARRVRNIADANQRRASAGWPIFLLATLGCLTLTEAESPEAAETVADGISIDASSDGARQPQPESQPLQVVRPEDRLVKLRVVDGASRRPLGGARVRRLGAPALLTDADGICWVPRPKSATAAALDRLIISRPGYATQFLVWSDASGARSSHSGSGLELILRPNPSTLSQSVPVTPAGAHPPVPPIKLANADATPVGLAPKNRWLRGTVFLPDGTGATGAQLAISDADQAPVLARGRLTVQPRSLATIAGAGGEFLLPIHPGMSRIVAVHPLGCASVVFADFEKTGRLRLEPWGRVDGSVVVAGKPIAGQVIELVDPGSNRGRGGVVCSPHDFTAVTDRQGRFAFDHVPPWNFELVRPLKTAGIGFDFAESKRVSVAPGEVTRVVLGEGSVRPAARVMAFSAQPLSR